MDAKKQAMVIIFLVLTLSVFVFAVDDVSNDAESGKSEVASGKVESGEECGFFCRIVQWWESRLGGEAAAGKAGERK
ncbi:hypothetical protein HYX13_01700 [Candidatus Woesearchaeota archaeon]|nr:hypothetical protein [Candidatus Woesearchaeota archaeon]